MKKKIAVGIIILVLAVIAGGLCLNWVLPKEISSFLKGQDAYIRCAAIRIRTMSA